MWSSKIRRYRQINVELRSENKPVYKSNNKMEKISIIWEKIYDGVRWKDI
jgi:hypothetical protein